MVPSQSPTVADLARVLDSVGQLIDGLHDEQWNAPTPCTDWSVRDLVGHLVGMNLVFAALLTDQEPPAHGTELLGSDPSGAYRRSAEALREAFGQPGVLERAYIGPLGSATGAQRLHIRLYDLLAHGWDLAKATEARIDSLEDLAESSLIFVQEQLSAQSRTGRFEPAQPVAANAMALDRLAAFLGRRID